MPAARGARIASLMWPKRSRGSPGWPSLGRVSVSVLSGHMTMTFRGQDGNRRRAGRWQGRDRGHPGDARIAALGWSREHPVLGPGLGPKPAPVRQGRPTWRLSNVLSYDGECKTGDASWLRKKLECFGDTHRPGGRQEIANFAVPLHNCLFQWSCRWTILWGRIFLLATSPFTPFFPTIEVSISTRRTPIIAYGKADPFILDDGQEIVVPFGRAGFRGAGETATAVTRG